MSTVIDVGPGASITVPTGWEVLADPPEPAVLVARAPQLTDLHVGTARGVLVVTRGDAAPLDDWVRSTATGLAEQNPTFSLVDVHDIELSGQQGFRMLGMQVAPSGAAVVLDQLSTTVPGADEAPGIVLSFTWPALAYDATRAAVDEDIAAGLTLGGAA